MQQSPRIATRASFFRGVENPVLVTRALLTIHVQDFTGDKLGAVQGNHRLGNVADLAHVADRVPAATSSAVRPYLRIKCSMAFSPSGGMFGFSSNGLKVSSTNTSPATFSMACSSAVACRGLP